MLETQYSGDTIVLVFPDGTGPALLSAMIAGVPYNRAHELEYHAGEVRMNVTMHSTLSLLKDKNREEYNVVIANGRKELKRLRGMKLDEVINVKDQRLEQDRLELEDYVRKQEEKRYAKEADDRLARESRHRQIEEARRLREAEVRGDGIGSNSPVVLGAVGVSVGVAAVAFVGGNKDEQKTSVSPETPSSATNSTETELQMDSPSIGIPEIRSLDSGVASSTGANEEESGAFARINGDRQAAFPSSPRPRDPVKAAEDAMQEYLDSDDGGSAWLQVMSDLMIEDDEDEQNEDDSANRL